MESSSRPASGTLNIALIAPAHGASPVSSILLPPAFNVVRWQPATPGRLALDADVLVLDLSSAADGTDLDAAELRLAARDIMKRSKAPLVMVAQPDAFPPDSVMSQGVRGYVTPSEMRQTLAVTVKAVHARNSIDEELRRKEAQIQNLLTETDQAFFSVDVGGINVETSETELQTLGYKSRDEILGKPMRETHFLRPSEHDEFMDRVKAQGHLKTYKMLFKKKGGRELIWVQGNCRLERDASGKPSQIHGIYRDVTASYTQQLYQKALSLMARTRRADEPPAHADEIPEVVCSTIYHATVARAVLFLVHDRESDALVVQHAEGLAEEHRRRAIGTSVPFGSMALGTTPATALRRKDAALLHDLSDDLSDSLLLHPVGNASESSSYVLILGQHTPAEGDQQMQWLSAFLTDAAHHLSMVVALQKNRLYKASHEASHGLRGGRRRVEDFLLHLLRALREEVRFEGGSIFRIVLGGKKLKLRSAATAGTSEVPLKGEATLDIGEDAAASPLEVKERSRRLRLAWESALRAQEPYHSAKKMWLNVPISSPDGALVGMLHAVGRQHALKTSTPLRFTPWDVEIFKAAAEQAELVVSLLSAEEQRSDLLARVTHEIRAPVNTIRANVDVLRRRPHDDAQFDQRRADIELEAEVLLDLARKLDGLFGGPRPEASSSDSVDVEPILSAVIRQMKPDLRERGLSMSQVEVGLRAFPRIRMPQADLKQIFFNLFRNAVLYAGLASPASFRVRIVSNTINQRPVIRFRDWGIGVVESDRERIFETGIRGSNVQEVQARGTGLGLAICRQIMTEHGGSIAVTNLNKPTEFTIEFSAGSVDSK